MVSDATWSHCPRHIRGLNADTLQREQPGLGTRELPCPFPRCCDTCEAVSGVLCPNLGHKTGCDILEQVQWMATRIW